MEEIKKLIKDSIDVKEKIIKDSVLLSKIKTASEKIIECYKKNGKVLVFGNGGSAADAQHIVGEFVSKFLIERKSLPAIALNCNTSILTAIGNDYSFDSVFSRQIEGLANKGDIAIGISTSGNSKNVLKALEKAKEKGCFCIGLTGISGGMIKEKVNLLINVPSDHTPRIQEAHITIGHIICEIVEKNIFLK